MDQSADLLALVKAMDEEDVAGVSAILTREPALADARIAADHGNQQTLLHRAIPGDGEKLRQSHLAIVRRLLDAGADVDAVGFGANNGHCTPITMAAWGGHAEMIRL